jgi:site-specific DNA-methyltransferase (adenine-specific)
MIVHVLRKPVVGTVAQNALQHGCGALNIDGCRIASQDVIQQSGEKVTLSRDVIAEGYDRPNRTMFRTDKPKERSGPAVPSGRWPANLVHDGTDEVVGLFPQTTSVASVRGGVNDNKVYGKFAEAIRYECGYDDSGSAARFFQQVVLPR